MILLDRFSSATTLNELRGLLKTQSRRWDAHKVSYMTYDDLEQRLAYPNGTCVLSRDSQPGVAALTLRTVTEQNLHWPDDLQDCLPQDSYRVCLPIMHWGSLIGVLAVAFDREPHKNISEQIHEAARVLGAVGYTVNEREKTNQFVVRTRELLVHAVEAQGKAGHVGRCSRIATALAGMLDCSAQARIELLQAAQYHDVGLLAFAEPETPTAQREHAKRGARLLDCHPDLRVIAPLVEAHHERYDGSGIPDGAKGDDLPLEAWILALTEDLVESWEKNEGGYKERLLGFFNDAAKHHHPDVVDALCGLVDSGKLERLLEA